MADGSRTPPSLSAVKSSSQACTQQGSVPFGSQELADTQQGEDWEGMDGSDLIFALDKDEEDVLADPPETSSLCEDTRQEEVPQAVFHGPIPLPSAPELDFSTAAPLSSSPGSPSRRPTGPVNPQGPKPLINLVKSLSTEIESQDGPSFKPQPLLSLVKSISTEISRLEPEVTPSKSDSKLSVHRWHQITQPKSRNGDSRTAPSSPSTSPSDSKGSFFKAQEAKFEDTKRRFSEAMQEPLSRLSKIMGDENNIYPRPKSPHSSNQAHEAPPSLHRDPSTGEARSEGHGHQHGATCGQPCRRSQGEEHLPVEQQWGPSSNCRYEICSYGDVIQVVEVAQDKGTGEEAVQTLRPLEALCPIQPDSAVPCKALACIALLAYNYFVLPLPPYVSGLFLGLACGFMFGSLLILLLMPKHPLPRRKRGAPWAKVPVEIRSQQPREPHVLKGWMNEMYFYDPETYHPSLTHSVFVTLEDSSMKLSYPKNNLPRRATFEEEISDVAFVNHQHYELRGAKVFLFPSGLARKRMWNKKYPICVLLPEQDDPGGRESCEHDTDYPKEKSAKKQQPLGQETPLKHPAESQERTLFLFGRTGREKEEWLQHLVKASCAERAEQCISQSKTQSGINQLSPSGRRTSSNSSSRGSTEDLPSSVKTKDLVGNVRDKLLLDYNVYMSQIVPTANGSGSPESPGPGATGSLTPQKCLGDENIANKFQTAWVNAVLGRMFWDFLREKYWAEQVSEKIQKKLGRIKLPYFMNELTLTELDMGISIPHILSASSPTVDHRGLWVDMEVTYNGALQMTLETKMNLCKLGKEALAEERGKAGSDGESVKPHLVLLADSDAESSSAGSSDEEDFPPVEPPGVPGDRNIPPGTEGHVSGTSTGRKILRIVDKIAKSKYFQKATENEFIKKKIEEVSNMPLLLTVEVQELTGTLTVNIPPPPTDRVWYSFKVPPQLDLKVRPKLGEREVTFIHVTEWIEKKLQHEFQKILVMPNMDDLILPLMHSGLQSQLPEEETLKDSPRDCEKKC